MLFAIDGQHKDHFIVTKLSLTKGIQPVHC